MLINDYVLMATNAMVDGSVREMLNETIPYKKC
jgi:hypothetical protein